MQNYLNNKPFVIKKYMFPNKALYWKTAFITSYSDEVLYFKGVLIEMIAFILKEYNLFMQIFLKITTIYYQKYIFTAKALYWNKSLHYFLFKWNPLFQRSSDWNKSIYFTEMHLFMQNCLSTIAIYFQKDLLYC